MSGVQYSDQQRRVFEWVEQGQGSAFVEAVAGCLAGDTVIGINRASIGRKITIAELVYAMNGGSRSGRVYDPNIPTRARSSVDGIVRLATVASGVYSGPKRVYAVHFDSGHVVKATAEHRFLTPAGYVSIEEGLTCGLVDAGESDGGNRRPKPVYRRVAGMIHHPYSHSSRPHYCAWVHRLVVEAHLNGMTYDSFVSRVREGNVAGLIFLDPKEVYVHHIDEDVLNNNLDNLQVMSAVEHSRHHGNAGSWKNVQATVVPAKVVSIVDSGVVDTYDLTMENQSNPNFLANGVVVHNSGKSTTLLKACESMMGSVALAAFNKAIVAEIQLKRPPSNVSVGTFHSFGFSALRAALGQSVNLDDSGKSQFIKRNAPQGLGNAVADLVGLAKQSGVIALWDINQSENWMALFDRFSIVDRITTEVTDEAVKKVIEEAKLATQWSLDIHDRVIDFNDMLWVPLVAYRGSVKKYDWVLVDEAQDTNAVRREMARLMMEDGGRSLWVGDRHQCHPPDTQVAVCVEPGGIGSKSATVEWRAIQDIKAGDQVVSYVPSDSSFRVNGYEVLDVAKRYYSGRMIEITADEVGFTYRCTPEHRCLTSFSDLRDHWAVYLMRRTDLKGRTQYRVGKCSMSYSASSGVSARMRFEKADACWILSTHADETEAWCTEQAVSGAFGLPQTMFESTNMTRDKIAEVLPAVWDFIGDNGGRGEACLRYFGRMPEYPLFINDGGHNSIKRPFVTQACNVLDGCLMLPYEIGIDVHVRKADWVGVSVSREWYEGQVHSLSVAGSQLYVADGLVTHNSIYGFSGADNDAVDTIIEQFQCATLPLHTTYRCSKSAVHEAQQFVPHIEAHENNNDGSVRHISYFDLLDMELTPGHDVVVCRLTKPLVDLAFHLRERNIPAHVEGQDNSAALLKLVDRFRHSASIDDLKTKLAKYRGDVLAAFYSSHRGAGGDLRIPAVCERIDIVTAVADQVGTVGELRERITELFSPRPDKSVTLCTVHRSKGREWSRVFVLGWGSYMPSSRATQDWEKEQERNLCYVAQTRTKMDLVYVSAPSP